MKIDQAGRQSALIEKIFSINLGGSSSSGFTLSSGTTLDSSFGITNLGTRASGGPVTAGTPYIVGEKRPELFVPNVSGSIIPDLSMIRPNVNSNNNSSSSGDVINHTYTATFSPTFVSPDPAENMKQFKQQMPMFRAEMIKLFKTDPGVRSAISKAPT